MKNMRMNQIIESLDGLGTNKNTIYTNQEIIDHLKELQKAMARGVFEKTHAENLRDKDIMIHFEALAKEYGLNETDTFLRFKANMNELGYTIGSLIKGVNGERIARRGLKLISCDEGIRILYNVQLEDEDVRTEYDAIVIAPYGLFVVEVKNWNGSMTISPNGLLMRNDESGIVYDIPGRMSVKEALLRKHLRELFPADYHTMFLFPDKQAKIEDNYHKTPIIQGEGISYEIKPYAKSGGNMTEERVAKIADAILSNHKEQRDLCMVKCDEIIADYAKLMVQIEAASNETPEELLENDTPVKEPVFKVHAAKTRSLFKQIDWGNVAERFVAIAIHYFLTAVESKIAKDDFSV
ncbi:MAG: nuclease-related domain-containing protein [Fastidiosipilaceae bacterium]|jgi:hypothetical protein